MNTIGVFAGRGDVILAMGGTFLIGVWAGWRMHGLATWIKDKRDAFRWFGK